MASPKNCSWGGANSGGWVVFSQAKLRQNPLQPAPELRVYCPSTSTGATCLLAISTRRPERQAILIQMFLTGRPGHGTNPQLPYGLAVINPQLPYGLMSRKIEFSCVKFLLPAHPHPLAPSPSPPPFLLAPPLGRPSAPALGLWGGWWGGLGPAIVLV